jgi:hypothetical protein
MATKDKEREEERGKIPAQKTPKRSGRPRRRRSSLARGHSATLAQPTGRRDDQLPTAGSGANSRTSCAQRQAAAILVAHCSASSREGTSMIVTPADVRLALHAVGDRPIGGPPPSRLTALLSGIRFPGRADRTGSSPLAPQVGERPRIAQSWSSLNPCTPFLFCRLAPGCRQGFGCELPLLTPRGDGGPRCGSPRNEAPPLAALLT